MRSNWISAVLACATLVSINPSFAAASPTPPAPVDPIRKAVEDASKLYAAGSYDQAAKVYQDTINATAKSVGPMAQLNRAILYSNLGTVYFAAKKFTESETAYKAALDIQDKLLSNHMSVVADTMQHYAALLRRTKRNDEADRWQTQAEYLLVGNLSGKNPVVSPSAVDAAQLSSSAISDRTPSSSASPASTPSGMATNINRIVQMNDSDKQILNNPLTQQKPVYRTEEYTESAPGIAVAPGGVGVGYVTGVKRTRQVLDHYETVPVSDAKGALSYPSVIADLQNSYRLSDSNVKDLLDAINSGGSAVELGNGWLIVSDEPLDPSMWHSGQKIAMNRTPEGNWMIQTEDGRKQFVAKKIATNRL